VRVRQQRRETAADPAVFRNRIARGSSGKVPIFYLSSSICFGLSRLIQIKVNYDGGVACGDAKARRAAPRMRLFDVPVTRAASFS
jgi:hypothetical protein